MEKSQEAFQNFKQLENNEGLIETLDNLGSIKASQRIYEEALNYFEEGFSLSESINDLKNKGNFLQKIGSVYMDQKLYKKALKYYNDSEKLFSQIGDLEKKAECLNSIGLLYQNQGKKPKAITQFEETLKILDKIGADKTEFAGKVKDNLDKLQPKKKEIPMKIAKS